MSMVIVRGETRGDRRGCRHHAGRRGTRVIESMLFGITGAIRLTLGGVTVLLAVLVVIGCLVPALKAARVDPMTTLRAGEADDQSLRLGTAQSPSGTSVHRSRS